MRSIPVLLLLAAACITSADARPRGTTGAPEAVGKASIGPTQQDITVQSFVNAFYSGGMNTSGGASYGALDADQFPVRNFTGTFNMGLSAQAATLSTTGPWVWSWDAGRSCFKIFALKSATLSSKSDPGITVTNGAGSGNFTVQGNCGQAGFIVFNWSDTSGVNLRFDGTYTQWNSNTTGRMWMIRQSDQARFDAGIYWTQEYVDFYKGLKPESIRLMSDNVLRLSGFTGTNVVNWNYRLTPSTFAIGASQFPPGTRCGGSTSFCTISLSGGALTAAAADDTPLGGWVDGEQLTGTIASTIPTLSASAIGNNGGKCQFTTTDTSLLSAGAPVAVIGSSNTCNNYGATIQTVDSATQFTTDTNFSATCSSSCGTIAFQTLAVTGKSGGSKLLVTLNAVALGSGSSCGISGAQAASFTYNSVLDKVLVCGSDTGISNHTPIEFQAQLANLVNANFWFTFPLWANDNYVVQSANLFYSNLNSHLKLIAEWHNEVWNFGQQAAGWASKMGVALGISSGPIGGPEPFQALRVRQINGNLLPSTSWAAAPTRLEKTFCFQVVASAAAITSMLNGSVGNGLVSPGSAAYQAYVGGAAVNYNTSPNRPGDFTNTLCYAPYTGGGSAWSGQSPDVSVAPTSFDAANLNAAVTAWNGGSQATAIALVDAGVRGDLLNRVQTVTASGTTFTTPLAHNLAVNDIVRCTVAGGTTYSGLNLLAPYRVLTTPTSTTFTAGIITAGVVGSAVNVGSAGSGTTSCGYLTGLISGMGNIFLNMSGQYTKWQSLAATGGMSPSPASGAYNIRWYEGALEPTAPSSAQCTALSINGTDCTTLATIVTAWKNDAMAAATTNYYFQTFTGAAASTVTTGAMPNSTFPSWFSLNGISVWALNSNTSIVAPSFFKTKDGFTTFSTN